MTKAHNQQRVTSHITLNEAISVEEKQLIKTKTPVTGKLFGSSGTWVACNKNKLESRTHGLKYNTITTLRQTGAIPENQP